MFWGGGKLRTANSSLTPSVMGFGVWGIRILGFSFRFWGLAGLGFGVPT